MKYVVITGAFGGMGFETTKKLAGLGYTVFALDKFIKESDNKNIIPITVDITDVNSVKSAFIKISEKTREIFAIIHFAGVYMLDSLVEISESDFEKIVKILIVKSTSRNLIMLACSVWSKVSAITN